VTASGRPQGTAALIVIEVFGLRCLVVPCPATGAPLVVAARR
jgi:hypothetical protein